MTSLSLLSASSRKSLKAWTFKALLRQSKQRARRELIGFPSLLFICLLSTQTEQILKLLQLEDFFLRRPWTSRYKAIRYLCTLDLTQGSLRLRLRLLWICARRFCMNSLEREREIKWIRFEDFGSKETRTFLSKEFFTRCAVLRSLIICKKEIWRESFTVNGWQIEKGEMVEWRQFRRR